MFKRIFLAFMMILPLSAQFKPSTNPEHKELVTLVKTISKTTFKVEHPVKVKITSGSKYNMLIESLSFNDVLNDKFMRSSQIRNLKKSGCMTLILDNGIAQWTYDLTK